MRSMTSRLLCFERMEVMVVGGGLTSPPCEQARLNVLEWTPYVLVSYLNHNLID